MSDYAGEFINRFLDEVQGALEATKKYNKSKEVIDRVEEIGVTTDGFVYIFGMIVSENPEVAHSLLDALEDESDKMPNLNLTAQ